MVKYIPSSVFRRTFPSIREPVVVTVLGHPIGTWTPGAPAVIPEPVAASAPVVGRVPKHWPGGVIGGRS
jgi:hypothetical protein